MLESLNFILDGLALAVILNNLKNTMLKLKLLHLTLIDFRFRLEFEQILN